MKLTKALAIIAATGASAAVWAAEVAPPLQVSAAELAKMVEKPANGLAVGRVPLGDRDPQVVVARRTRPGEVEVHEAFADILVVRAGRATMMVGGTVAGNRQTGPGEWRGGTITGATAFKLAPGDVLWIPAGVPHQVSMPDGGDFTYLVVKSGKAP